MKVRIVAIGKNDSWYEDRKDIVGQIGEFTPIHVQPGGFRSGDFSANTPVHLSYGTEHQDFIFFRVKVHQLKENEE